MSIRGRIRGRRSLVLAVLGLIVATLFVAYTFMPSASQSRQFKSGAELAKVLIQRAAENNGVAALSSLGGKLCLGPGPAGGIFYANELFPGFAISYRETTRSSGLWYVFIGYEATRTVEIYGIGHQFLLWEPSDDVPMSTLVTCPIALVISPDGGTVQLASGPKRVPRIEKIR